MGGSAPPKIPDYKIYKVSDAPALMELEAKLARHGLKDPWIRNEVWRYSQPGVADSSVGRTMARSVFRGFPIAVGVAALLICGEKVYSKMYPPAHGGH